MKSSFTRTDIKEYASILEISPYTDTKNMSVYDFLFLQVSKYYFQKFGMYHGDDYLSISRELYKSTPDFVVYNTKGIEDQTLKTLVELYQENERYCLKNNNNDIHLLQFNRMKSFKSHLGNSLFYISKLDELEVATANTYLKQDIKVEKARQYYAMTTKNSERNYYPEALSMLSEVLNAPENQNAKAEAEEIRENILKKKITLNIPAKLYQNQNYRAFVNYRNVDTLQLSYYKIPMEILAKLDKNRNYYYNSRNRNYINTDSLVLNYIEKHQPEKTIQQLLPSKQDHFEYSTEILMPNLNLGAYILFFETKNPLGYPSKKAYAYHITQVSNIDYIRENEGSYDTFQLLNRKTGQVFADAIAKSNSETLKSDKNGKVNFAMGSDYYADNYTDLYFVRENDTLYSNYYKSTRSHDKPSENFDAKAMVFFDRAIYRPGQKVYFKGFLLKNQNKIKSVVPNVTVHITIANADDDTVKEFNIQTNEFGSFTGEYDIPKNVLTGNFRIRIEEPDNDDYKTDIKYYDKKEGEHSFWDKVYYRDDDFRFKVEEYKRPTFEISFDQIKENYTIGDTVVVSGNVKTLAGSNLTNVKVSYTVSKYVYQKDSSFSNDNYIDTETLTDSNGNFKIELKAREDKIPLDSLRHYSFSVQVNITDLNGETRSANTTAIVGREMLRLGCSVSDRIERENPKSLQILATTLNNFPVKTKGTITFIELSQKSFLIQKRNFPELFAIGREDYKLLFPYEAYDRADLEIKENKILTLPFDTEKTDRFDLAFLKNFNQGNYKIQLEATDQNGNVIKSESRFQLFSKIDKTSREKLFSYNQINKDKDYLVFEFYSAIPNLYIISRMYDNQKKKSEVITQLKNGYAVVKFPKKTKYDNDILFHFSTIWENQYYEDQLIVAKEEIEN
ncbi:MAG: MG2 domain-containing protein [Phycisphaerales bacterium]